MEKGSCNCIEEINVTTLEKVTKQINADHTSDEISDINTSLDVSIYVNEGKRTLITSTNVSISFLKNGKWKKGSSTIHHSFCPFCGVKINYD